MNTKHIFSKHIRAFAVFFAAAFSFTACPAWASPDVMLADVYRDGIDVSQYLASEKLDGVRARWDGNELVSRNGNVFAAPRWFTKSFPSEKMDGELWIGRNSFEKTVSTVRKKSPHSGWRRVRFMAFDLPAHGGGFQQRHEKLKKLVAEADSPYLKAVAQFEVQNSRELGKRLDRITKSGGEGLMLHWKNALYKKGRSKDLLKLKKFYDAEAVVVKHEPGKGKFKGMLGSLTVETPDGIRFKIGTGFTDEQRGNPPPVGSVITYKYTGLTKNGKPKFASFWRVRKE